VVPEPRHHPDKAVGLVAQFEGEEQERLFAAAINRLGEREKMVIVLYYYERFTLAQIGEVLGVSQECAEALHKHAVSQLPNPFPGDFGA
jgi:RNA polymerase sigma factor FliA